jgi:hypothetical protein
MPHYIFQSLGKTSENKDAQGLSKENILKPEY